MIRGMRPGWIGPALLVLAVVGVGCAAPTETTAPAPDLRFVDEPPIALDVGRVEVHATEGAVSGADADSEVDFAKAIGGSPNAVLRQWARDRLRAAGRSGDARFEVVSASIKQEKSPRAKGAVGLFGSAPGTVYIMTVEARLQIIAADGQRAMASARVVRTKSLEGNRTRAERQRFWTELTETTVAEFDSQMERAIRRHLNPWVL